MSTRLLTWNINGYRAILNKGLEQILDVLDADIVCFQETKAQPEQIELDEELYPYQYKYSANKKGYSGTMIASRIEPLSVHYGLGVDEMDTEGRVIRLEFEHCNVITVYTPNTQGNLKRKDFRQQWDQAFYEYLSSLEKPFMLCGDLNVARTALDIWDEKDGLNQAGYTEFEKEGLNRHLSLSKDVFRELYPQKRQYTWWSYYSRGRERNEGWRIDYWLVSNSLFDEVEDITIYDDIYGSDHCPVLLEMRMDIE